MVLIEFGIRSPSIDTRPDRRHGSTVIDDIVAVMLGTGGASMVGKDPHHRAHRKFRRRESNTGPRSQNAMFLIGVDHDQIGDWITGDVTDYAKSLIDEETRGATISRHRHPASVDDD